MGGTREEFKEGRRQALAQAAARSNEHKRAALEAYKERLMSLVEKGYSLQEAKEFLQNERFEELESSGAVRLHAPIKRERVSPYSWCML